MFGSEPRPDLGGVPDSGLGLSATLTTGRLWAMTSISVLIMALPSMPSLAIGVLGPFIVEDLSISSAQLGLVTTVLFLGASSASGWAGSLADRLGLRRLAVAIFVLGSATLTAMALAPTYPWLLVAAGLGAAPLALCNPVTNALLARFATAWRHQALATGIKQSGVQTASVACGTILPPIALLWGWRSALFAPVLVGVLGAIACGAIPASPPEPTERAVVALPRWVGWLTVYSFLLGVTVASVTVHLPLYAVQTLAWSPTTAGLAAASLGALGLVSRLIWVQVASDVTRARFILISLSAGAALAVALVGAAAWLGDAALWCGALLFGCTAIAWNAVGMRTIIRGSRPEQAGTASGRVLTGFFSGFVVGPPLFGLIADGRLGYVGAWAAASLACVAATVILSTSGTWHEVDPATP